MEIKLLNEPILQFSRGEHICPRAGIYTFDVSDIGSVRPESIAVGFVGLSESIPSPIEVRLFSFDESPEKICKEILYLTKMNWNNTQFDRKFPITIDCSRNVGEILKYLTDEQEPQIKYSFYM